jgi:hypothetical protein
MAQPNILISIMRGAMQAGCRSRHSGGPCNQGKRFPNYWGMAREPAAAEKLLGFSTKEPVRMDRLFTKELILI